MTQVVIKGPQIISALCRQVKIPRATFLNKLEKAGIGRKSPYSLLHPEEVELALSEFNIQVQHESYPDLTRRPPAKKELCQKRPPVVTIMGHVDHGKTTILDYIRHSSVASHEVGGITQHIGAFSVILQCGRQLTFLDTPGHASFSSIRSRGAKVTDIIVLVVAADDGVMDQTIESIKHAKNANVPIIVAINKCDKYFGNIAKVKAQLQKHGIMLEEQGGDVQVVYVSGLTGMNMDKLEDAIVAQSEVMDLVADRTGPVEGTVIESKTKEGLGNIATVLVERGTLERGAVLVADTAMCRVRTMLDHRGIAKNSSLPSDAVEVTGWKGKPHVGTIVIQAENEKEAKAVVAFRQHLEAQIEEEKSETEKEKYLKEAERVREMKSNLLATRLYVPTVYDVDISTRKPHDLSVIIKYDCEGSGEAILKLISEIPSTKISTIVFSHSVGELTQNDIENAKLSDSIIILFNVDSSKALKRVAKQKKVEIKTFDIIYRLCEFLEETLVRRLPPVYEEVVQGVAKVTQLYQITENKKQIFIAGCTVDSGKIKKEFSKFSFARVLRGKEVVHEGEIKKIKHFKKEVESLETGNECGIMMSGFQSFEEGDRIQCIKKVEIKQSL